MRRKRKKERIREGVGKKDGEKVKGKEERSRGCQIVISRILGSVKVINR